jgi:actin-like ATPase involved in cell morphogenesis
MAKKGTPETFRGVGIDLGTMNIVSARKCDQGVQTQTIRDAFLDLDPDARRMLRMSQVKFIEREDDLIVVGDDALQMAAMFGKEARRPLSAGLISSSEIDSLEILGILVRSVLGDPVEEDEVCFFSVPAAPIDADRDVIYHRRAFERIVEECGFEAYHSNEAMAIIYAEGAADQFSGIALSYGSGMTNVALAVKAFPALEFSVSRGGDWIDEGAAKSVPNMTQSRICTIKEKGINLMDPGEGEARQHRAREA